MGFYNSTGFLKLLARFRKDQSAGEEKQAMETWYDSLDDPDLNYSRKGGSKEKVWAKIMEKTGSGNERDRRRPVNHFRYVYYGVAAVLIFVSGLIGYFTFKPDFNFEEKSFLRTAGSVIHENNSDTSRLFTLPDGSKVILEPLAKLRYAIGYNKISRTVQLQGNAFFSVVKNKRIPFIVQTDLIETKVLGTEFTIKKNTATGQTEVEVITGKVEVNVRENKAEKNISKQPPVFLTANLKATFLPVNQQLVLGLAAAPRILHQEQITQNLFVFNDSPLKEVIGKLESAYGVSIEVENEDILNCPITADLSNEPLSVQLDIVMTALNANFSVSEKGIYIKDGGCAPAAGRTN